MKTNLEIAKEIVALGEPPNIFRLDISNDLDYRISPPLWLKDLRTILESHEGSAFAELLLRYEYYTTYHLQPTLVYDFCKVVIEKGFQ